MARIGVTATRKGLTHEQLIWFEGYIRPDDTVVHGDCVGGDAQLWGAANHKGCRTEAYPCDLEGQRAHTTSTVIHDPQPPLKRNHDIVDNTEVLLAFPGENAERLRSGVWATIRYARKVGAMTHIMYPNGEMETYYDAQT